MAATPSPFGAHQYDVRILVVHYNNLSPAQRDRLAAFAVEVGCPLVHQAPPTLEEITARVGYLCRVAHRMGERGFDHLSCETINLSTFPGQGSELLY